MAKQCANNQEINLLFPSLSTGDNQVPSAIAVSSLIAALKNYPEFHHHVVLCEPETSIMNEHRSRLEDIIKFEIASHSNIDEVVVSKPRVLAVECNWRCAPNANLLSRTIHSLCSEDDNYQPTAQKACELAGCLGGVMVENCFPVSISSDHILNGRYGIAWLIYVRGPNMNGSRPDCIEGADANQIALRSLQSTYEALFKTCKQLLCGDILENTMKPPVHPIDDYRGFDFGEYRHPGKANNNPSSWRTALYEILENENSRSNQVFHSNSDCVVIYDGYPKSRMHLLALPRWSCLEPGRFITHPSNLKPQHIQKLKQIQAYASRICDQFQSILGVPVRAGFHSIPSMEPLHIHIISQDFDSPWMKNKKHWNSFRSPFFVDLNQVVLNLEAGRHPLGLNPTEAALGEALQCVTPICNCGRVFPNVPTLRQHLEAKWSSIEIQTNNKKLKKLTD